MQKSIVALLGAVGTLAVVSSSHAMSAPFDPNSAVQTTSNTAAMPALQVVDEQKLGESTLPDVMTVQYYRRYPYHDRYWYHRHYYRHHPRHEVRIGPVVIR